MDIMFVCPNCKQQLEAEAALAGSSINCPTCSVSLVVPEVDPANLSIRPAAKKEEKHFAVPVHEGPTQALIEKPRPPLEAAKDGDKRMRVKCIKRTECVEVGKDHFDDVVSDFLGKVGESNVVSINTINYTHVDMGSRMVLTDYGVMIVYKG